MIVGVYINPVGWPLRASQKQLKVSTIESYVREILLTLVIFFSVFTKISPLLPADVGTFVKPR